MGSNWQDDLTLLGSMDYILTNAVDCDISFKLGKAGSDVVPAHKFVLAIRSSVFRAMLFGPLAEKDSTVGIPDVESDTFKCFLRYLYTDKCTITADNVTALMYTAHKYNVGRLVKDCGQFMTDNLSTANVCNIMETAHLFDVRDLRTSCLVFIEDNSDIIMKEKLLSDLGQECLGDVLKSDNLKAREEDIFSAVLFWADRRCTEKDLEVNDSNRRHVLGDLLYLLRFPLMSQEKFVSISKNNPELFTSEEQIKLLRGHITRDFSDTPFPSKHRATVAQEIVRKQDTCYRFKDCNIADPNWTSNTPDLLQFMVSEAVDIVGLILFGRENVTYNVHIEIVELSQMTDTTVKLLSDEKTFKVLFNRPVAVKPCTYYTLKVSLGKGEMGYYGQNGMESVTCETTKFTFKTYLPVNNGTSTTGGQIFGIIFWNK